MRMTRACAAECTRACMRFFAALASDAVATLVPDRDSIDGLASKRGKKGKKGMSKRPSNQSFTQPATEDACSIVAFRCGSPGHGPISAFGCGRGSELGFLGGFSKLAYALVCLSARVPPRERNAILTFAHLCAFEKRHRKFPYARTRASAYDMRLVLISTSHAVLSMHLSVSRDISHSCFAVSSLSSDGEAADGSAALPAQGRSLRVSDGRGGRVHVRARGAR
eukprot:5620616-Pleurochrysis_carterae.AAC.1